MEENLKEKTAKGLAWGLANNGIGQLIGMLCGIIIARRLSTADYGMTAMIAIFPLIAKELQNSGFTAALTNLKSPTDNDYNAVFWFNILVGVTCYVLLFFAAPLISAFYHDDAFTLLCRVAFLVIILSSLGTAQQAWLFKNLRVKQQAKAGITAVVLSNLTGVTMACLGCRYWSIACMNIVYIGVNTLLLWHYSPWRPSLHIDFGPVRRMFRFSVKLLATNITTHINNNVLSILLGHRFTESVAGTYAQANNWSSKCAYLVQGMIGQVAQPVLVGLNDDRERQLKVLRKLVRFTAFISFPLMFGLALVAREFIVLTITERWLASAELMQLLCISWAVVPISLLLSNMVISKGRSDIYFWVTCSLGVLQIVLLLLLARFGMRTMVTGFVTVNSLWVLLWHFFTRRLVGYRLRSFLKDTLPFAFAALAVMVVTHYLTLSVTPLWLLLTVRVVLAALLYYLVMRLSGAKILQESMQFLKKRTVV